jgi:hypothetical protein
MKHNGMNYSEEHVKQVLEAVIPGSCLNFRPEQSNSEYDFDLIYKDGRTAALEVTRAIDETWVRTSARIRSPKKGGSSIKAKHCKKNWFIFVTKHADIKKIREHADKSLAELETSGIDSLSLRSRDPKVDEFRSKFHVMGGSVLDWDSEPTIFIGGPLGGGAVGASIVIDAGEKEIWKDDNRKKLSAATTDERHLAVYFDGGNPSAWNALTCGAFVPPNCCPKISEEITHLWLIGPHDSRHQNTFVVWYANKQEHWQSAEVVFDQQPQAAA